jgi:hypothetical protein
MKQINFWEYNLIGDCFAKNHLWKLQMPHMQTMSDLYNLHFVCMKIG